MQQSKPHGSRGFRPGAAGNSARIAQMAKLKPRDPVTQFAHASGLLSAGRLTEGSAVLDTAIDLDPFLYRNLRPLGIKLWNGGRRDAAVAVMMYAARLPTIEAGLLVDLAGMLVELGQPEPAIGAALMALEREPASALAQAHLGNALFRLGQFQAALPPLIAAVQARPDDANLHINLGAVLLSLGQFAQSLVFSREAIARDSTSFQAHLNTSAALAGLGQLPEAEQAARSALAAEPDHAEVRHGLAALLLSTGRFTPEAWQLYEGRLGLSTTGKMLPSLAHWRGEDIAGQTILVHAEQGLGDTLQFIRYIPMLAALGAKVVLVVQPELRPLLEGFPGVTGLLTVGDPPPPFDMFSPLLSLPGAFGTTVDTIPPVTPVVPNAALAERWRVPPEPEARLEVGIVWAGNRSFVHDATRSLATRQMTPLSTVPGVRLHSLQKAAEQPPEFAVLDRMEDVKNFADTAALIAGLDLIITIDSAVAHLAGSMGKQVWMLSRFAGCWRWLRDRDDTPWYPTMRIYRQAHFGEWGPVISRVRQDLAARAAKRFPTTPPGIAP